MLALGNPTLSGGPFYDAFTPLGRRRKTFTINAFDTPNLEGLPLEALRLLPKDYPRMTRPLSIGRDPIWSPGAGYTRSCGNGAKTRRFGSRAS